MRRILRFGLLLTILAIGVIAAFNSSFWVSPQTQRTSLAHRGLAQTYPATGLTSTTCTAARIFPPEHAFIENTLPSMRAAFAAGADIVELDVHPTTDGQFAVFHDWTLECRTDGRGVTREHSLADLKKLDVGYGYTADGGKTFPLRGTGVGLLPSLDEVLGAFPDKRLLIHIKSNDADEGRRFATRLKSLPPRQLQQLMIYGGALPVAAARDMLDIPTMSGATLKRCLIRYFLLGWSGYVPPDCERSVLLVPVNYAPWLWGWPNRFLNRMNAHGSDVFILGRNDGEDFSQRHRSPRRPRIVAIRFCRRHLDQPDRPHRAAAAETLALSSPLLLRAKRVVGKALMRAARVSLAPHKARKRQFRRRSKAFRH